MERDLRSANHAPDEEHRRTFMERIAPVIRQLCRYIVPRARLFPASQVKNVPHNPPFDSPAARIAGALRRYAEQITIPEELLEAAKAARDSARTESERRIIQELVERELRDYEGNARAAGETVGPNPAWRVATKSLILERLGYPSGLGLHYLEGRRREQSQSSSSGA